jgi:hypothetical protein
MIHTYSFSFISSPWWVSVKDAQDMAKRVGAELYLEASAVSGQGVSTLYLSGIAYRKTQNEERRTKNEERRTKNEEPMLCCMETGAAQASRLARCALRSTFGRSIFGVLSPYT